MTREELEAKMTEINDLIKQALKGHGEIVWTVVVCDVISGDIATVHPTEVNGKELLADALELTAHVPPDMPLKSKRNLN